MAGRGKPRGKGHPGKAPPSKGKGTTPAKNRKRKATALSEKGHKTWGEGHVGSDSDSDGDDSEVEWNNQGEDEWDSSLPMVKDNLANVGVVVPLAVKETNMGRGVH